MDLAALRPGRQGYPLDKVTDGICGFVAVFRTVQCFRQPLDLLRVNPGDVGVDVGRVGGGFCHSRLQHLLLGFEVEKAVHQRLAVAAVLDGIDDVCLSLLDLGQLGFRYGAIGTLRVIESVGFRDEAADGLVDHVGRHQPVLQPGQHAVLETDAGDGTAIVAGTRVVVRRTGETALTAQRTGATTGATVNEAGQQRFRSNRAAHADRLADRFDRTRILDGQARLPCFDRLPESVIDDAEVRHLCDDPVAWRVDAADALAGARVLHIALPVPDETAYIEFVVEEARAALGVAAQRAMCPQLTFGTGDTVGVEASSDGLRADAVGEFAKHTPDDFGLRDIDRALAADGLAVCVVPLHDVIAVAQPAAGFALLDPPAHAAVRLLGEVLQEQRIHRPLQANMQFADLAFGQRHQRDTGELKMFVKRGDVGLVTADSIECFGEDDAEAARLRILDQLLDAGTQRYARARDRGVLVGADDLPAFARRLFATDPELIVDGRRALLIGGIAGV